ncbi:hypothetical protein [Seohaeicola zhoushanensis]|uniref:Cytochrome P450 n=1 Tax=Seohaeicola zhoushanensis TaxID=1569283 RepID=A0A8J3GYD2_9RHOB|nr:hypothetical protein [Seohaeicola zhoushanensis]GHF52392.1 hypothetical protein GCM10017056_24920 [Seohaeicola zhoushanensis]
MNPVIPDTPTDILKARDLDVVPYAARVAGLSERLGIDLSVTVDALNAIPLCLPRDRHAEARRDIAAMIAGRNEVLRAELPHIVRRHFARLTETGRVEVMREAVAPAVAELISLLVGMPIGVEDTNHVSRIFSQSMGVARRKTLEAELGRLNAQLRATFPSSSARELGLKLSLMILGRDAMMGTFGCSLAAMAQAAEAGWNSLDWPDLPPRTGVPYIDRVANADVMIGEQPVAKGQPVRAHLADFEASDDPRLRLSFFGAGAHLCLGRALAMDSWRALGRFLTDSSARPKVLTFELRRDDVFNIPGTFEIEVSKQ